MKKSILLGTLIVGAGLFALGVAQSQTTTGTAPKVNVGPTVAAKANSPAPSATAKNQSQKSSIGKGSTSVKSSTPASFWTDAVDIDDDGTVEDNQFLWDAQRGVLYTYREDDFSVPKRQAGKRQHPDGDICEGQPSRQTRRDRVVRGGLECWPVWRRKGRNVWLQVRRFRELYGVWRSGGEQ